jgi:hypothetical protein
LGLLLVLFKRVLNNVMSAACFCGLGTAAANTGVLLLTTLVYCC